VVGRFSKNLHWPGTASGPLPHNFLPPRTVQYQPSIFCNLGAGEIINLATMFGTIREQIDTIFRGDPAAKSTLEIFFCYPGFHAILLHRLGLSSQVPAHRAFERDEDAIAEWRTATWAKVRGSRR